MYHKPKTKPIFSLTEIILCSLIVIITIIDMGGISLIKNKAKQNLTDKSTPATSTTSQK
ncbi:MAG: hypothetical protein AAF378_22005 [Cyanobacteria bacterium P01_A01_bin.84]